VKKYLNQPHLVCPSYNLAFATAAEMTDAEKAAEEAAMKTVEQEMMESAAPYTPPEGKLTYFQYYFYCPIYYVVQLVILYIHIQIYLTLCN